MEVIALKEKPELRQLIQTAVPAYRKHKAFVSLFPEGGVNINSYWSGGSKDEFFLVHVPTQTCKPLPTTTHPYFDLAAHGVANQETEDLAVDGRGNVVLKRLPSEYALINAGWFCGARATAHIYLTNHALTEG